jgi:hypothetical protein
MRIYRYVDVLGQTQDAWTRERLHAQMMGWGRGSQVEECGGSKDVSKRARTLVGGSRQ